MSGWGVQTVKSLGRPLKASAGEFIPKPGGVTIDWSKITAVASNDKTLTDGRVVKVGEKYIRYGTVLARLMVAEVKSVTLDGGPTGGYFTLTFATVTSGHIAYNASAADVQTALEAMVDGDGIKLFPLGSVVVTGSGGGPYTLTFNYDLGNVGALTGDGSNLTGNGDEGITINDAVTAGSNSGKFAPYDISQTDGRQVLRSGDCFVLDETVVDSDERSDYPNAAFDAGLVFKKRVLNNGDDLLTNPTETVFHTAFPGIRFVTD